MCGAHDVVACRDNNVEYRRARSESSRLQASRSDPLGHGDSGGNQQAVLFGDPSKPGLYGVMTKWLAGNHFSRPHFHPNDRYITVLSGTWWVGSGPDFDPDKSSVPMPAGSVVTHYAKQVHWDGAKDTDAVLLIVGEAPATSTPFVAAPAATNR
jgi:hypothetical protein